MKNDINRLRFSKRYKYCRAFVAALRLVHLVVLSFGSLDLSRSHEVGTSRVIAGIVRKDVHGV